MSKRYSGKSFKDSSVMKKPKFSLKEKRKLKKEKKKSKWRSVLLLDVPLRPYDRITAVTNSTKVRDQEEKNKIFNIY